MKVLPNILVFLQLNIFLIFFKELESGARKCGLQKILTYWIRVVLSRSVSKANSELNDKISVRGNTTKLPAIGLWMYPSKMG